MAKPNPGNVGRDSDSNSDTQKLDLEGKTLDGWDTTICIPTPIMDAIFAKTDKGKPYLCNMGDRTNRGIHCKTTDQGVYMLTHMLGDHVLALKTSTEGHLIPKVVPYVVGKARPEKGKKRSDKKPMDTPEIEKMKVRAYAASLGRRGAMTPCWYSSAKQGSKNQHAYHHVSCTTNTSATTSAIWANAHQFTPDEMFGVSCKNCIHLWLAELILDDSIHW